MVICNKPIINWQSSILKNHKFTCFFGNRTTLNVIARFGYVEILNDFRKIKGGGSVEKSWTMLNMIFVRWSTTLKIFFTNHCVGRYYFEDIFMIN